MTPDRWALQRAKKRGARGVPAPAKDAPPVRLTCLGTRDCEKEGREHRFPPTGRARRCRWCDVIGSFR